MRVMILVLSSKQPPYDMLYEAQRRTWGSVDVPGVETHYYWCDSFAEMPWKLKQALDEVWDREWNFVFRTNSSSYVDKRLLRAHAETLPKNKCYQGIDGGGFASGSGFFLSRDVAEDLRKVPRVVEKALYSKVINEGGEDAYYGGFLAVKGVSLSPGARRFDFWQRDFERQFYGRSIKDEEREIARSYHIRCKSLDADRGKDVIAMEAVHEIKERLCGD